MQTEDSDDSHPLADEDTDNGSSGMWYTAQQPMDSLWKELDNDFDQRRTKITPRRVFRNEPRMTVQEAGTQHIKEEVRIPAMIRMALEIGKDGQPLLSALLNYRTVSYRGSYCDKKSYTTLRLLEMLATHWIHPMSPYTMAAFVAWLKRERQYNLPDCLVFFQPRSRMTLEEAKQYVANNKMEADILDMWNHGHYFLITLSPLH